MSYGCPCLVSDIPENREALGGHGFTFRNKDPQDLAARLASLLADPARLMAVGAAARSYVMARFSWDTVAHELEELYRGVLRA